MVVTVSQGGYIKRTRTDDYQTQKRGQGPDRPRRSRRRRGLQALRRQHPRLHPDFLDKGKVYVKKVWEIPEAAPNSKGRAIVNFVGMEQGERVAAIASIKGFVEGQFVVTLTEEGPDQRRPS